eukprot:1282942-Pleurochrysis_carterae.AAC.1
MHHTRRTRACAYAVLGLPPSNSYIKLGHRPRRTHADDLRILTPYLLGRAYTRLSSARGRRRRWQL